MHRLTTIFTLITLLCAAPPPLPAQATAELLGVVRDPEGLGIPDATIELIQADSGIEVTVKSGPEGRYHLLALPTGPCTVTVSADGFRTLERSGIVLSVGEQRSLDLSLEIGTATESIQVSAGLPPLASETGTVAFVRDRRTVMDLPLDGRNFLPLVATVPGVALPPGSSFPRINGSRPRVSEYLYDGISVLQPEPGQVAYFPVIDAIEEFRVETSSYAAEYGRSNGGIVLISHRRGSNTVRGTAFAFVRNESLNARNLFASDGPKPRFRRNQFGLVLGGPIVRDRTFFFGSYQGTRRDAGVVRTSTVPTSLQRQGFFDIPVFDPATTSTARGTFLRDEFENDRIPQDRFDPAAVRLLAHYPKPNVLVNGVEATANNYRRTGNGRTVQDQPSLRVDHNVSASQRLFGRYEYLRDRSRPVSPLPDGSGDITSGVIGDTRTRSDSLVLQYTWAPSSNQFHQFRFGYTRRSVRRSALRMGRPASEAFGIPGIPLSASPDAMPVFDISGLQQLGPSSNANSELATSVTEAADTWSFLHGPHSLKIGADLRIEHLDVLAPPRPTGWFGFSAIATSGLSDDGVPAPGTGNALASFLLGEVTNFEVDVQKETLRPRATVFESFLQDDFQAGDRLSLNVGVRYTLNFPSTVVNDHGAVFNLETQRLDFLGREGYPRSARDMKWLNFGPRVGLAYRLSPNWLVRAGYGVIWIEQAGISTPFTTPLFPFIQSLSESSLDAGDSAFALSDGPSVRVLPTDPDAGLGQGVFSVERSQGSGYAQQWNLMFQRSWGASWTLGLAYLGSGLTNLGVPDVNLNQLTASQLAEGPRLNDPVPNPFFGEIPSSSPVGGPTLPRHQLLHPYPRFTTVAFYRNNVGHSTYHSAQAVVERRLGNGLALTLAYTWSKLIDDAGKVFNSAILTGPVESFQVADSHNRRIEKDESTGSVPHMLSMSFTWELPVGSSRRWHPDGWVNALVGGWQLAGILRAQSGSPLPVVQATNFNAFAGFGIQRPNRIDDPTLPRAERSVEGWFDTAAFTEAGPFTLGTSSRNPVRGPGYWTLDVALSRNFPNCEGVQLELRAEAFNVTNTPQLQAPNTTFGDAGFGTITSAFDPRVFEVAMKVHF